MLRRETPCGFHLSCGQAFGKIFKSPEYSIPGIFFVVLVFKTVYMKIKYLLTGLMLSAITMLSAQSSWQWVNTGFNYILMDISFPPGQSQIGFAVGENVTYNGIGIILKTTDGGDTWSQISSPGLPGLEAVCFTDLNTGYIGGWQNYFAKTTDGGLTWTPMTVNSGIWYIKEIDFWDNQHGIVCAAGAMAFVTADGGNSWTPASGLSVNVEDLDYASSAVVYAVGGDEKIAKSVNGGLNWTTVYTGQFQSMLLGVDFYGESYGIVGGEDGKVLKTTNGGQSWSTGNAGNWHLLHGVHVYNTDSALVAGTIEGVYKTTNGGITWILDFSGGNTYALYKIARTPDNTLFISGSQGMILRKKAISLMADFTSMSDTICTGQYLTFDDLSTGNISAWQWSFPGGIPSSSTLQYPVIQYPVPGNWDVSLIVSDGMNSDTLLKQAYVQVITLDTPVITGALVIPQYTIDTHSVVYHPGNHYFWNLHGGSFVSGNTSHEVIVQWGPAGTTPAYLTVEEYAPTCYLKDSVVIVIDNPAAIPETHENEVLVYPEAGGVDFLIESKSGIRELKIYDLSGRIVQVFSGNETRQQRIHVSRLSPGIYLLGILNSNNTQHIRKLQIIP